MEIQGKVIAVLPIKDGVGKTSGNEWKSREFVLETEESRPQSLCLQLMNANIDHKNRCERCRCICRILY